MKDSEKALAINPYSTKARIAKAEALYSMGNFEKALVEFERGWRLRQDPEIKTGLVKCRDVILNTVGEGVFSNNDLLVQRVIRQMRKQEMEEKKRRDKKTKPKGRDANQLILGKMQKDVEFLEDFLKFQSTQTIGQVTNLYNSYKITRSNDFRYYIYILGRILYPVMYD